MTMRTPLGRVRGLGSAKDGTDHFWTERMTSVALVPLTIIFLIIIIATSGTGYDNVRATLASPLVSMLILLYVLVGIYHMKIGMEVIIEDYVHSEGLKIMAFIGNLFFSGFLGIASVFAVLKISFGG